MIANEPEVIALPNTTYLLFSDDIVLNHKSTFSLQPNSDTHPCVVLCTLEPHTYERLMSNLLGHTPSNLQYDSLFYTIILKSPPKGQAISFVLTNASTKLHSKKVYGRFVNCNICKTPCQTP